MDEIGGGSQKPTQAEILAEILQTASLFHIADMTTYADVTVDGHRETWAVRSRGFKRWLTNEFCNLTGGQGPSAEALNTTLNAAEAQGCQGPEHAVFIRVGRTDDAIYLDLCDTAWRAVEIDAKGWRIVDNPPVHFRRTNGMRVLPDPVRGGSIEELRSFLNVRARSETDTDADFILAIAWLLAILKGSGPYPILALAGEQGTAKSFFARVLRAVIDPNTAALRALPRDDRDLFIAAVNSLVIAFDNISNLPFWLSDTLCRLATDAGFATRLLYSDTDEILFDACRPIILNGITDYVTRADLADRSMLVTLEPIAECDRKLERKLWAGFKAAHPRILGALLDAASAGLKNLPNVKFEKLPRMADFAEWAVACEPALWPKGTFMAAHSGNVEEAVEIIIEGDVVALAVRKFVEVNLIPPNTEWTGTATDLLFSLSCYTTDETKRTKEWPKNARALSDRLRRSATFLRKSGIGFTRSTGNHSGSRSITIRTFFDTVAVGKSASPASPASPDSQNIRPSNGLDGDAVPRTVASPAPTVASPASPDNARATQATQAQIRQRFAWPANPLKTKAGDADDAGDAKSPTSGIQKKDGTPAAPPGRERFVRKGTARPGSVCIKCYSAQGDVGLWVCAVERRRFPVGASPTRQPLQPEVTGAAMEVTK
jgi:hypothetical protein